MSTPKHEDLAAWLNAGAQFINPERMQRVRAIAAEGLEEQLAAIRGEAVRPVAVKAAKLPKLPKRKRLARRAKEQPATTPAATSAGTTSEPSQADAIVEVLEAHPEGALPRVIVDAVLEAHPTWSRTSVANKLATLGREGVRAHVTGIPPKRMYFPGPAPKKKR